jgi:hypothetical protein
MTAPRELFAYPNHSAISETWTMTELLAFSERTTRLLELSMAGLMHEGSDAGDDDLALLHELAWVTNRCVCMARQLEEAAQK